MLYLICTEDKNREKVEQLLDRFFDGYTIICGQGYWKGTHENSMTISIVPDMSVPKYKLDRLVDDVAAEIKRINNQESVLVLCLPAEVTFI